MVKVITLRKLKYSFVFVVFMATISCSTQKDAMLNKIYHQINTQYNGLFYAEKYLKEGIKKVEKNHKENYAEILKINRYGDLKAAKSAQSSFDNAIEKATNAIQQHSMEIDGDEKNKLIDHNYIIIGQAQFYKQDYVAALNTFNYVTRKSKREENKSWALIWSTRCHQALGNHESLKNNLLVLEEDYYLNKKQDAILNEIQAEQAINEGYYLESKQHLLKAISKSKEKPKITRMYFILGQLDNLLNNPKEAQEHFSEVIKRNPDYEFVFNAKLNRAKAHVPGKTNYDELSTSLQKMLKDVKNKEYQDQIYFTLASLQLKNKDTLSCVESLELSTKTSLFNKNQKLESHYLLANIFWKQENYVDAYNQSDSAFQLISPTHPNYTDLKKMRRSTKKVAAQYNIINYNDSIVHLSRLPEEQRNKIIDEHIELLKQEDLNQKTALNQPSTNNSFNSYEYGRQSQNSMSITSGGGWYFYNPSAMSLGYSEFLSRWGNRKLEDNWRRKNKNQIITEEDELFTGEGSGPSEKEKYSREYYLSQLPLEEEKQIKLLLNIETAYYDLASVFKEELENYEKASEIYIELMNRFPKTEYRPLIYFNLHNINLFQGDTIKAHYYIQKIESEYPESNYLNIINGETNTESSEYEKMAFEQAYELFEKNKKGACAQISTIASNNTQNTYLTQIKLLKILCEAQGNSKGQFISMLQDFQNKNKEQKKIVSKIDTIILTLTGEIDFNQETIYSNHFLEAHYFLLTLSDVSINLPQTQATISNFNKKNYKLDSLQTSNLLLTRELQLLKVGDFKNKEEAMAYYYLIQEDQNTRDLFLNNEIGTLIIAKTNYNQLLKEKKINEYVKYFNDIYLLN